MLVTVPVVGSDNVKMYLLGNDNVFWQWFASVIVGMLVMIQAMCAVTSSLNKDNHSLVIEGPQVGIQNCTQVAPSSAMDTKRSQTQEVCSPGQSPLFRCAR